MFESNGHVCFSWIENFVNGNFTTLEDMNYFFLERHLGGITFICIMMVFGLLGNISVLWIYATKFKATNYRTYTLWLAGLDMTNCCLGMPFLLVYHTNYLKFPDVVICKGGRFVMVFTANASAFILVVIAIDRYIHVCKPFDWENVSHLKSRISCGIAAVLGLLISWPAIVLFGNHTFNTLPFNVTGIRCWEEDRYQVQNYLSDFYVVLTALSFIITVVLVISYSLIVRFIYKNKQKKKKEYTKKVTFILLAVTMAYVLSALPHNILLFVLLKNPEWQCDMTFTQGVVIYIFVWSNLINNTVNPFIYGYSDAHFRKELKKIFTGVYQQISRSSTSYGSTDNRHSSSSMPRLHVASTKF